jgi:hypothetical protein
MALAGLNGKFEANSATLRVRGEIVKSGDVCVVRVDEKRAI